MVARMWHGRTKASDAEVYKKYLFGSGIPEYRSTEGNRGAWVLCRIEGEVPFHYAHILGIAGSNQSFRW